MPDLTLTCKDCHEQFVFEEGEQRWFAEREFQQPKRCPSCRAAKKAMRKLEEENAGR